MTWAIVAITKKLPDMSVEDYKKIESPSDTMEDDDKHMNEDNNLGHKHNEEEHHH